MTDETEGEVTGPETAERELTVPPPETKKATRKWRRGFIALGLVVVATWVFCGVVGVKSCASMMPGSAEQTGARTTAQAYVDALAARDWERLHELSDPEWQAAQSAQAMQQAFSARPELFDFDSASFLGHHYASRVNGGDRMRLSGQLSGRSSTPRTFWIELREQPDGTWRVRAFHVDLALSGR